MKDWEEQQISVFKKWCNSYLKQRKLQINDIRYDLKDGIMLINLAEIISNKSIGSKYHKTPKLKVHMLENTSLFIGFIKEVLGVKLVGIGSEDIVEGNVKLTLGLLWSFISKVQLDFLDSDVSNSQRMLLDWCKECAKTIPGVKIDDFSKSWRNGMPFLAIIKHYLPSLFEDENIKIKPDTSTNLALNLLENIGISVFLDQNDIECDKPDDKCIITQVSEMYGFFTNPDKIKHALDKYMRASDISASLSNMIEDSNGDLKENLISLKEGIRALKGQNLSFCEVCEILFKCIEKMFVFCKKSDNNYSELYKYFQDVSKNKDDLEQSLNKSEISKATMKENYEREIESMKQQIEQLSIKNNNELKKAQDDQLNSVLEQHKSQIEHLEKTYQTTIDDMKAKQKENLKKIKRIAREDIDYQVKVLKDYHEQQLDSFRKESDSQIQSLKRSHKIELEKIKKTHEEVMEKLMKTSDNRIQELEKEVNTLIEQKKSSEALYDDQIARLLSDNKTSRIDLEKKLEELNEANERLKNQIAERQNHYEKQLSRLKNQNDSESKGYEDTINEYKLQLKDYEKRYSEREKKLNDYETKLSHQEENIEKYKTQIARQEKKLSEYENKLNKQESRIDDCEDKINKQEEYGSLLNKSRDKAINNMSVSHKNEIDKLTKEHNAKINEMEVSHRNEVNELKKKLGDCEKRVQEMELEKLDQQNTVEYSHEGELQLLREIVRQLQAKLDRYQQQFDDINNINCSNLGMYIREIKNKYEIELLEKDEIIGKYERRMHEAKNIMANDYERKLFDEKKKVIQQYEDQIRVLKEKQMDEVRQREKIIREGLNRYNNDKECASSESIKGYIALVEGLKHEYAHGTFRNLHSAYNHYKIASRYNIADAIFSLARCLELGNGVDKDEAAAIKLYKKAAELDHHPSLNNLGAMLLHGRGERMNEARAVECFKIAADNGNPTAQCNYAILLDSGNCVPKNQDLATVYWKLAAEAGHPKAINNLAVRIEKKDHTPKEETVNMYKKAASDGHTIALFNYSLHEECPEKKVKLWEKASEAGSTRAMNNYAIILNDGKYVLRSPNEALRLLEKASGSGDIAAIFNYAVMLLLGNNKEQDKIGALRLFKAAASKGHAKSMNNIAVMYLTGNGVEKNFVEGLDYLQEAANLGDSDALFNLGLVYLHDDFGVKSNIRKANEYFAAAHKAGNPIARNYVEKPTRYIPTKPYKQTRVRTRSPSPNSIAMVNLGSI